MKIIGIIAACLFAQAAWASDPSAQCFSGLEQRYSLMPLREVIALGSIKNQTMEMMTNTRHPSAAEKENIKLWAQERDLCFARGEEWRNQHMPAPMRAVFNLHFAKNRLLIAELYLSRVTFGEFASRRATLSSELNANMGDAMREGQSEPGAEARKESESQSLMAATTAALHAEATRLFESRQPDGAPPIAKSACANAAPGAVADGRCN